MWEIVETSMKVKSNLIAHWLLCDVQKLDTSFFSAALCPDRNFLVICPDPTGGFKNLNPDLLGRETL